MADIQRRRAAVLRSLGRTGEAIDAYERAIVLFDQAGDIEKMAASSIELGWVHMWNADVDATLRLAGGTLGRLGEAAPVLRCRAVLLQALAQSIAGNPDAAFAALAQAQQLQRSLNSPDLDRESATVESFAQFHSMQVEAAVVACRDAVRRSRAVRDMWSEVDIGFHEPYGALVSGSMAAAVKLFAQQLPVAERVGHQPVVMILKLGIGCEALVRGDFENAERIGRESLAFGHALATGYQFLNSLFLGFVGFFQGRRAEAVAHLQNATDTEPPTFFSGCSVSSLIWASLMKAILPLAVCYENGCRVCPRPDGWQGLARGSHSSTSLKASRSSVAGTKPPRSILRQKVLKPPACTVMPRQVARCSRAPPASPRPAHASGRAPKLTISARSSRPTRRIASASQTRARGMRTCCWRATTQAIARRLACCLPKPCRSTNRSACRASRSARAHDWRACKPPANPPPLSRVEAGLKTRLSMAWTG